MDHPDYIERWKTSLTHDLTIERLKTIAEIIKYPERIANLQADEIQQWSSAMQICMEKHAEEIRILWSMQEIRPSHIFAIIKKTGYEMEPVVNDLIAFWTKHLERDAGNHQKWYMAAIMLRTKMDYSTAPLARVVRMLDSIVSSMPPLKTYPAEPIAYVQHEIYHLIHNINQFDVDALFHAKVTEICKVLHLNAVHDRSDAQVQQEVQKQVQPILDALVRCYIRVAAAFPASSPQKNADELETWMREQRTHEVHETWAQKLTIKMEGSRTPGFLNILDLYEDISVAKMIEIWFQAQQPDIRPLEMEPIASQTP